APAPRNANTAPATNTQRVHRRAIFYIILKPSDFMVYSIVDLRNLALHTLTPECYQSYLSTIEPAVKEMLRTYFGDWQQIETQIRLVVMKANGIYKGDLFMFSDSSDIEKNVDEKHLEKYRKLDKMPVSRLLDQVYNLGVIGNKLY